MIPFSKPTLIGNEEKYILKSMQSLSISGNGKFTKKCHKWFEKKLSCEQVLLTTSCTHALEISAILLDIKEGDEVIMSSYTFVSTANAFALRGAKIIFVDIRPDTMNIDEMKIEQAITKNTRVIVPVHYAGVACEMDMIMEIANRYNLFVVEDAAQCIMSSYKGKALGTIGHLGTFSFHETKNFTSAGEGGLLIINDDKFMSRAEIIRDKGTNKNIFLKGEIDKYSWVDIGSSYLVSDISAAFLWAQLQEADTINNDRLRTWNKYYNGLKKLALKEVVELPIITDSCTHNAHIFYLKVKNISIRNDLLSYLGTNGINATFHYVPLHTSLAGLKFGRFIGKDEFTTRESERLIRLPLYYSFKEEDIFYIISKIELFFCKDTIKQRN